MDSIPTGGNWTYESLHHINYLEMYAILLALKTFATDKSHTHIRIMTDNSTAVSVINHMGTSHSHSCNSMAKKIWEWCIERNIWLSVAHIPGKDNFVADFESRRNQKEAEWMLSKASLQDALNELGFMPEIDLFASRINTQFKKYVSYKPDPSALAIDAFTLDWSKLMFYAFPPFSVIPAVLSKIVADEAMGVCILPDWPTQGWYPKAIFIHSFIHLFIRHKGYKREKKMKKKKVLLFTISWRGSPKEASRLIENGLPQINK